MSESWCKYFLQNLVLYQFIDIYQSVRTLQKTNYLFFFYFLDSVLCSLSVFVPLLSWSRTDRLDPWFDRALWLVIQCAIGHNIPLQIILWSISFLYNFVGFHAIYKNAMFLLCVHVNIWFAKGSTAVTPLHHDVPHSFCSRPVPPKLAADSSTASRIRTDLLNRCICTNQRRTSENFWNGQAHQL